MNMKFNQSAGTWVVAVIAILFGLLTIKSGGLTLFVDGADREAAGNYVPFVLWFNFMAGFVYLVAGAGLFMNKQWAVWLSIGIVSATAIVFMFFGLHIFNDGLYENRTVVAMSLRTIIWAMIAIFSYRRIIRQ